MQILPPGTKPSPNGLPTTSLYYRNDDGGAGYGKDSLLHFTAPADGEYLVRIRDVQGLGGENYSYRLTVRRPHPDFRLAVNPRNPNVPMGGSIVMTVTAFRMDVTKLRYRDWDDLIGYCTYSAMPVGRFVLDVHGESRALWPSSSRGASRRSSPARSAPRIRTRRPVRGARGRVCSSRASPSAWPSSR